MAATAVPAGRGRDRRLVALLATSFASWHDARRGIDSVAPCRSTAWRTLILFLIHKCAALLTYSLGAVPVEAWPEVVVLVKRVGKLGR